MIGDTCSSRAERILEAGGRARPSEGQGQAHGAGGERAPSCPRSIIQATRLQVAVVDEGVEGLADPVGDEPEALEGGVVQDQTCGGRGTGTISSQPTTRLQMQPWTDGCYAHARQRRMRA